MTKYIGIQVHDIEILQDSYVMPLIYRPLPKHTKYPISHPSYKKTTLCHVNSDVCPSKHMYRKPSQLVHLTCAYLSLCPTLRECANTSAQDAISSSSRDQAYLSLCPTPWLVPRDMCAGSHFGKYTLTLDMCIPFQLVPC
jgi:hypothetical protein